MKMTNKLANNLMDCLVCVAISANGGCPMDEHGKPCLSKEQMEVIDTYAQDTFCSILGRWEDLMGEEWEIEDPDELREADEDRYDEPADLENGFNPYEGGYDFDC